MDDQRNESADLFNEIFGSSRGPLQSNRTHPEGAEGPMPNDAPKRERDGPGAVPIVTANAVRRAKHQQQARQRQQQQSGVGQPGPALQPGVSTSGLPLQALGRADAFHALASCKTELGHMPTKKEYDDWAAPIRRGEREMPEPVDDPRAFSSAAVVRVFGTWRAAQQAVAYVDSVLHHYGF